MMDTNYNSFFVFLLVFILSSSLIVWIGSRFLEIIVRKIVRIFEDKKEEV
jgi:hypothetical protein